MAVSIHWSMSSRGRLTTHSLSTASPTSAGWAFVCWSMGAAPSAQDWLSGLPAVFSTPGRWPTSGSRPSSTGLWRAERHWRDWSRPPSPARARHGDRARMEASDHARKC